MSEKTDIEKLARDVVRCADDGLRPQAAFVEDFARAYLAEHQRADDLAKRERELRELVIAIRDWRTAHLIGRGCFVNESVIGRLDTLLAKEPQ